MITFADGVRQSGQVLAGSLLSQRTAKYEKRARSDQRKTYGVVPGERLLEIKERKSREHRERDHLLHGLELGGGVDRAAEAVGRHRHAVFHQRDTPAHQNRANERRGLVAEMAVP